MEFRRQWLNYILKKSSELYTLKQQLLVVHGRTAFIVLLQVWWLEIRMALVSFPAFLFLQTQEVPQKKQREYQLRRTITLLILLPLAVVWLTRLGIWVIIELGSASDSFIQGPNQGFSTSTTEPWKKLSLAAPYVRLATPTITPSTIKSELVFGQAATNQVLIVSLQKRDATGAISFIETRSDEDGMWSIDRKKISALPAGTYVVSVVAYDAERQLKSALSPSVTITIPLTWWQWFEQLTDVIIYGTIGLLILLAIIMSFLNF